MTNAADRVARGEGSDQRQARRRRVESALTGRLPLRELSAKEGVVFNAEISAALEESLATGHHVADRAAHGKASIVLDKQGRVSKYLPDGTHVVL